jgi:2-octaprenyl-6-methoxyphenol hydroxylase
MQPDYDCLIIGGGLVGASLACALQGQDLRIGLIEAVPMQADSQPSYDDRGLVIAPASQRILSALGVWPTLLPAATAIQRIHVSDRGHFGFTRLDALTMGVDALGHVVVARDIGLALTTQIAGQANVDFLCPARVEQVSVFEPYAQVSVTQGEQTSTLTARLLIVADGGDSAVRRQLGVDTEEHDYGQTAVVANVTPARNHEGVAFERFTADGPLAVLPLVGHRCVVVWAMPTAAASDLLHCEEAQFLSELSARFGYRLGRFLKVGRRRAYPLKQILAKQQVGPRFAIIGNAAHTIHPNAAQGLNLGLRDAAALAECMARTVTEHGDIGSLAMLNAYAGSRSRDQDRVVRFSDGLTQLFYNDFMPLVGVRNLAMLAIDLVPPLKRALVRRAMGLTGRQPRLVRGLTL